MKNQITQDKVQYEGWENKRRSANQDIGQNKSGQQSQYSKGISQAKNLLAVVKLDIGEGQTDVIRVYQGDDIIKVVKNFCQQHELDEKCVVHMVRHITHEINLAQSKETKRQAVQHNHQNEQFLPQDAQQQSIQSSEKEDIQSQTTNSSSKQNYLQFNNPLSPGQAQGINLDQFSSTSTNKSHNKSKEGLVRNNVVEKGLLQQEGEVLDDQLGSDNDNYEIYKNHYFSKNPVDFNPSQSRHKNKEDIKQIQSNSSLNSQEVYQARNSHKVQNEGGQNFKKSQKEYQNISTNYDKSAQQLNQNKKQHQKMQENYEKWHKFIELKNNLNARSREDLKSAINNQSNLNSQNNQQDDKRARSQSQRYQSPMASQHTTSQFYNKNSQLKSDRRHAVSNHQNNSFENTNDFLDEYQILEKIRNEGLLPNNLTKAQQKMVIGNTKFSPKRKQKFLTSGSSGQPSSSSSSYTEKNLKNIATQLSNIEEMNSSISQNTSRIDATNNANFQSSNSLLSSSVNQNILGSNFHQNAQNLHSSTNLNKSNKIDDQILKKHTKVLKTPTRNSNKFDQSHQQVSPLSQRNSIKTSQQVQQQLLGSLQKRVQGIVPLLDIKKAQADNSGKLHTDQHQYSQTQRSPRNIQTQRDNYVNEDPIKISGNLTDRDQKGRQEEQHLKYKNKVPLTIRMKQNGSPDNSHKSSFNISSKLYNQQKQQELNQKNQQESLENNSLLKYLQESSGKSSNQDNIVKVDLESYQRHKKVKTLTPQTDKSHKRDDCYNDYFQNTSQLDKSTDLASSKQSRVKNSSSIHQTQNINERIQKSPIRNNISNLEKQNTTFDVPSGHNISQIHKLLTNGQIQANNSVIHNPSYENNSRKESKVSKNGPFILPGSRVAGNELQARLSPPNKIIQQNQNLIQDQSSSFNHPHHNELLVNRLLRQKEIQKPNETFVNNIIDNSKSSTQQPKEQQKKQDVVINQVNTVKMEFQDFLYQKIFKKMDSDGDGTISVLDVDINSLKTDILEVLQNFLLDLADNGNIKYTFNSFLEYINSKKQMIEALQQIYNKKYLNKMDQAIQHMIQSQTKQIEKLPAQSPKQQFLQKQDQHQLNKILLQQQEQQQQQQIQQQQMYQQQSQQQVYQQQQQQQQQLYQQQQQYQQQLKQQQQHVQSQNKIVNNNQNNIQKTQNQSQIQQSYLPLQQQINQFNEQVLLQQQNQQQQLGKKGNDITFNFIQPPSRNSLQSDQLSQPKLHQEFSFQPKFFTQLDKQQLHQGQQQIQEEDDNNEEDPITHFVDLSSHLKKKNKTTNDQVNQKGFNFQQEQVQNKPIQNKEMNNNLNKNIQSPNQQSNNQNVDHVNFSFSEDPQQSRFVTNTLNIKANHTVQNNVRDINISSQNHSPSFHEQNNSYAGFGSQSYSNSNNNNNPQDNIGQELLVSFSNQSIPFREPSFGNNNNHYNQFLNSHNDNNAQNSQQNQVSAPQIISGRYKNLVQKQFNINTN
ncbi:hypothetical protein TTHERM_00488210 (macronuclear) [Tetrahymena thermophila SB210]|uniref:EF-hand domain-containing protein n=1 Tax=Tetrahymena thermophila (strain SB210) TaxID=312017 RepID=Q23JF3_TETTS|nr:hypothetical protein TTHERM_00488210 [Tetrahymena thermophila SB210]EAR96551.2 hypothetical protein TTHERM_00488210 [Tetrahymena thermophila SB210]|eukprot:XP_001016796.2 hypothetical protein TTHERM_00488210 [Tetrahymena thermophila SB210]